MHKARTDTDLLSAAVAEQGSKAGSCDRPQKTGKVGWLASISSTCCSSLRAACRVGGQARGLGGKSREVEQMGLRTKIAPDDVVLRTKG
jgi:hypothetical protein